MMSMRNHSFAYWLLGLLWFTAITQASAGETPTPGITANGSHNPITVSPTTPININVNLDPGNAAGRYADWWAVAYGSSLGWYSYVYPNGWVQGIINTAQTPLLNLSQLKVFSGYLPSGQYTFYFGVDMTPDKILNEPLFYDSVQVAVLDPAKHAAVRREADYILSCQFIESRDLDKSHGRAYGAINNVLGEPTWVVPGENAVAIMGLITAYQLTGIDSYLTGALLAAHYLVNMQNSADGAWYDQYSYDAKFTNARSLRHTAEVMTALDKLDKLGYYSAPYDTMQKGARFLLDNQNTANKGGQDDGCVGGGKDSSGNYQTWRWTSDNAYAYQALKVASTWAAFHGDASLATQANQAADQILRCLNTILIDPSGTHWTRVVDANDQVVPTENHYDWISYAPLMLDIPLGGFSQQAIGGWIHQTLQKSDGAVVWDNQNYSNRRSPGYSFQAALAWLNIAQNSYVNDAMNWAENSGLWMTSPDANGINGGWIDWTERSDGKGECILNPKPDDHVTRCWERFIDTSAYYIMVRGRAQ